MKKEKKLDSLTGLKPSGRLLDSICLIDEPVLEKYARYFRFQAVVATLSDQIHRQKGTITIVDYGCGQDILFYKFLAHQFPEDMHRISYIGIDPLIKPRRSKQITLIAKKFEQTTLATRADIITMFAVLEHVDDPQELLDNAYAKLKPSGCIIATTPSWL